MKSKLLSGTAAFVLLIALAHVWINIGFSEFARDLRVFFGAERATLRVAFLPVT